MLLMLNVLLEVQIDVVASPLWYKIDFHGPGSFKMVVDPYM